MKILWVFSIWLGALLPGLPVWAGETLPDLSLCRADDMLSCEACMALAPEVKSDGVVLQRLAESPRVDEQMCAMVLMEQTGAQEVPLDLLVASTHEEVRYRAIEFAANSGTSKVTWRVVYFGRSALKSGDERLLLVCLRALGRLVSAEGREFLLEVARDGAPKPRRAALASLSSHPDAEVERLLFGTASNVEVPIEVRLEAIDSLGRLPHKRAVAQLGKLMKSGESEIRERAVLAMGTHGNDEAVAPLTALAREKNSQQQAIEALTRIRSGKSGAALWKLSQTMSLPQDLRDLALLGAVAAGREEGLSPLLERFPELKGELRSRAIAALGASREPRAIEPLLKMVESGCTVDCDLVLWALKQCSGKEFSTLEEARKVLEPKANPR